jgi:hypothetical protein
MKIYIKLLLITLLFVSCTPNIPKDFTVENKNISIYPDYNGLTIPVNIAALNFNINDRADEYITKIHSANAKDIVIEGAKVQIKLKDWKKLLEANKGGSYSMDIFLKKDGKWLKYNSIINYIVGDSIDEYLSYRLIEPGYMGYEEITINQRNLTNFETREIYNNLKTSDEKKGQCVNCHSYQNYHTDNMQMHFRENKAGTVIVSDGKAVKVNTKTDQTISGGVYTSWHPTEKLIAYSVNKIGQSFHAKSTEKVEVIDTNSDLILYDVDKNEVRHIVNDKNSLETWPYWSPQGDFLYYASAYYDSTNQTEDSVLVNHRSFKYDILRISFDKKTWKFGKIDTVFYAVRMNKSASFPRESPDGKYLLITLADYGNFHIWHKSSDLYLIELESGRYRPMTEINSPEVDSYHSWSSNGRWIIFSSRRDDGSYTRPYISYFDKDGKATKPFILPQEDPDFYGFLFKSFNIPEFMVQPVKLSPNDFYKAIQTEAKQATYKK